MPTLQAHVLNMCSRSGGARMGGCGTFRRWGPPWSMWVTENEPMEVIASLWFLLHSFWFLVPCDLPLPAYQLCCALLAMLDGNSLRLVNQDKFFLLQFVSVTDFVPVMQERDQYSFLLETFIPQIPSPYTCSSWKTYKGQEGSDKQTCLRSPSLLPFLYNLWLLAICLHKSQLFMNGPSVFAQVGCLHFLCRIKLM